MEGIRIDKNRGKIRIMLEQPFHPDLALSFSTPHPDHHILNVAYTAAKDNPREQIILVTKDVNLRMKAKSVGLLAQDYKTDRVKDVSALYKGHRLIENVSGALINQMYKLPFEIEASELAVDEPPRPNEFFILRNSNKSALSAYDPFNQKIKRVDKKAVYGITPRNAEQTFALNALMNQDIQLVSLSGKAGTGKTLVGAGRGA